jgi:hypothetical protein
MNILNYIRPDRAHTLRPYHHRDFFKWMKKITRSYYNSQHVAILKNIFEKLTYVTFVEHSILKKIILISRIG